MSGAVHNSVDSGPPRLHSFIFRPFSLTTSHLSTALLDDVMSDTSRIHKYEAPMVMAEIGCNHMGQLDIAKDLLDLAKRCGCNYAKFQKRKPSEVLTPEQYCAPHPVPYNSYGSTYGAHREFLEFSIEQHKELKAHANLIGLGYSCSVWDVTSAREIISLNPDLIKVGSPSNMHWDMMKILRDEYCGDVHISTGMTTCDEIEDIVQFWEHGKGDARNRVILYSCTSGYPVPFEDVCLLELLELRQKYSDRVKAFGFSGHHNGIAVDVAAYTLGAVWNERHFTKNRTWKGTDHAASLEPGGMEKLVRDLHNTYASLTYKKGEILPIEQEQRTKLKWGFYNTDLSNQ